MPRYPKFISLICFGLLLQLSTASTLDLSNSVPIPSGFYQVLNETGVQVYRKDYQPGEPDFVTRVDLRQATLRNLTGSIHQATISRKSLAQFWQEASTQTSGRFRLQVIVNGTFFGKNRGNVTEIAFGLKVRNQKITDGYGLEEYPGLNKTFSFDSFAASTQIQPHQSATFEGPTPDVIGALAVQANKSTSRFLGRTFVGILDRDRDTQAETVLFFSSSYATQADAEIVLRSFGATDTAMLDGGGSTGLIVDGIPYIQTHRPIPHAIAIYADKPDDIILDSAGSCLDAGTDTLPSLPRLLNCNGSDRQRWSLREGRLEAIDGQCLEVSGDYQPILQPCNDSKAQQWRFQNQALQASNGTCLDIDQASSTQPPLSQPSLNQCDGRSTQRWQRID